MSGPQDDTVNDNPCRNTEHAHLGDHAYMRYCTPRATGRLLCGFPMTEDGSVTCRNTAPCPVHRDQDAARPSLYRDMTGQEMPPYAAEPGAEVHAYDWSHPHADGLMHQHPANTACSLGVPPFPVADLHDALADDDHDWSVRHRLSLVLGRPALATRLADALPPLLGAELCDRLDTLVNQARTEAIVNLENTLSEGITQARARLEAESAERLKAVHDERYRGNSRLS